MAGLTADERTELTPRGTLRVAVAVGEARSALWATRDRASGKPVGVTVDLAAAFGRTLQVPVEIVEHSSSGHIVENADADIWDVTFVPVDAARKERVDFGPNYYFGDSTYLVRAEAGIEKVADMDREDLTIVGVEGTATLRSARRTSKANAVGVAEIKEALRMFQAGEADAIALGRESLLSLDLPGTVILPDHFHATGTAVAVPKGRPAALARVSALIEGFKEDGTLRAIFDANGMANAPVAPQGSRS